MKVSPAHLISGTIRVPGDKSISHRAAILAAMAKGTTRISNFSTAEDCSTTLRCLGELGVAIGRDGQDLVLTGVGKRGFHAPEAPLDCGNSGTTARLLSGLLAGQGFDSVLIGDDSLSRRPMKRIIEPLTMMGGQIASDEGCLPLKIAGRQLQGITYQMPVASAQLKSCVLLAALLAEGETTVIESAATRDHTERMLNWLGVERNASNGKITVNGGAGIFARDISVPGDLSSAAFFLVAAACLPGSHLSIADIGLNPTRTAVLDLLRDAGATLSMENVEDESNEPRGTIRIRGGLTRTDKLTIDGSQTAAVIDEIPVLAVIGTQLDGGIEVRDAGELRHKETDRIAAVVENLRRMNATVAEFDDGFVVAKSRLRGAVIESFDDHRIAMAFAIAGLLADGETEVKGAECVDISFPDFFDTLASVVRL